MQLPKLLDTYKYTTLAYAIIHFLVSKVKIEVITDQFLVQKKI